MHLSISPCSRFTDTSSLVSHPFPLVHVDIDKICSDAIYVFRSFRAIVCHSFGSSVLSLVDIRRVWKRQLFLCHHAGLELRTVNIAGRHHFCGPPRGMGTRLPRTARKRSQTGVVQSIYHYLNTMDLSVSAIILECFIQRRRQNQIIHFLHCAIPQPAWLWRVLIHLEPKTLVESQCLRIRLENSQHRFL